MIDNNIKTVYSVEMMLGLLRDFVLILKMYRKQAFETSQTKNVVLDPFMTDSACCHTQLVTTRTCTALMCSERCT